MASANVSPPTTLKSLDYSTGKDDAGKPLVYATVVNNYRASAAVAQGAPVSFTAPTSSAPLSVHESDADTATDEPMIAGIALNAAAAGEQVAVGNIGYVLITDGDSVSAGNGLPLDANAGELAGGATYNPTLHSFVALSDVIADFYGSGLDACLAICTGPSGAVA